MQTQPASSGWRNAPTPMGSSPTTKSKVPQGYGSAVPRNEAETARRSALAKPARADCKKAQAPETRSLRILYFPPRASKLAQIGNFARSGTGRSGARPTIPSMSAILSICTNRKNGFQQFFRDRANSQAGVFPRHHHQQSKAPLRSRSPRQ